MVRSGWFPATTLAAVCLAAAFVGLSGCDPSGPGPEDGSWSPRRKMRIICPWAVGGGTDQITRFWADALERELGKTCIPENRTGGSGAVGHQEGALAKPDGHTLTMITFELCTMHRMGISQLTHRDFRCILQVNADPAAIIVRKDASWTSLGEFLEEIRREPGKIVMSGTGQGGAWDLARAGMLQAAGLPIDSVKWTSTRGAGPALSDLTGGNLGAVCCSVPEAARAIEGGELKVLAVLADERLEDYPDVPTAKEQGVDWSMVGWRGLAVPKETPEPIVAQLEKVCRKIAESPEYEEFMAKSNFGMQLRSAREFTDFLEQQDQVWKEVIAAAGFTHD